MKVLLSKTARAYENKELTVMTKANIRRKTSPAKVIALATGTSNGCRLWTVYQSGLVASYNK